MTTQSTLVAPIPSVCEENLPAKTASETISFRSVAASALNKLRSSQGKQRVPSTTLLPQAIPVISSEKKVGVRFHLKDINYDLLPIEMPAGYRGEGEEQNEARETDRLNSTYTGLRFCWTRGQSAASEEFIQWTRSHGETRGTLVSISSSIAEFESNVKVPAGSRWYARAITATGSEVDLTGIVSAAARVGDMKWHVTCRLSNLATETEINSLRSGR